VNERFSYSGSAVSLYSHTGTHVCGLTHIGHHGVFWNGRTADDDLGSRGWTRGASYPAIIGRGVLLDIAAVRRCDCLPESYAITPDDIRAGYRLAGTAPRAGDVVVLRTGRMGMWPDRERFLARPPGLGMDAARMLCEELGAMTVGLDVGGEALPSAPGTFLPIHAYLAATAGVMLIENMWLEELAREGIGEIAILAAPMKLRGSSGAPVRPLAYPRA
jgi:kynurenine formamidase